MLDQPTVKKIVDAVRTSSQLTDAERLNVLSVILQVTWEEERTDAAKTYIAPPAPQMTMMQIQALQNEAQKAGLVNGKHDKIAAIKRVRELTGLGLKEAKDFCDKMWKELGW